MILYIHMVDFVIVISSAEFEVHAKHLFKEVFPQNTGRLALFYLFIFFYSKNMSYGLTKFQATPRFLFAIIIRKKFNLSYPFVPYFLKKFFSNTFPIIFQNSFPNIGVMFENKLVT